MNIVQFRAREIRNENRERRQSELGSIPVTIRITEAEVSEAFEDLLCATNALREAQEAMNRAHDRYVRLSTGRGRG